MTGPRISPDPTGEEAAAIVAAIELAWPRPVVLSAAPAPVRREAVWKWSGRWWAPRAVPADRRRP